MCSCKSQKKEKANNMLTEELLLYLRRENNVKSKMIKRFSR